MLMDWALEADASEIMTDDTEIDALMLAEIGDWDDGGAEAEGDWIDPDFDAY